MTPSRSAYHVQRVADEREMLGLREQWTMLTEANPQTSVYLTWEWVNSWWRHHEPGWELWVMAACNQAGELVGVLPLTRMQHRYGPLKVARLAFVGDHRAYRSHLDVLARPAEAASVLAEILRYLGTLRHTWDVLDLECLAAGSPSEAVVASSPGLHRRIQDYVAPYTVLPATWDEFMQSRLSSEHRWEIRNRRRKLEREHPGQVSYERVRTPEDLPVAMDALAALHQKRWHARGQGSSFDHASFAGFHREIAEIALRRDWLRLYLLKVDGKTIAAEYAFLYRGVLSGYATAFDQDWGRYSPGQLIMAYTVEDAIAEGVRVLDLGRGAFDYKFRWTDQAKVDAHLVVSHTLTGHLWLEGGMLYRTAKRRARATIPKPWLARLGRLISRQAQERA